MYIFLNSQCFIYLNIWKYSNQVLKKALIFIRIPFHYAFAILCLIWSIFRQAGISYNLNSTRWKQNETIYKILSFLKLVHTLLNVYFTAFKSIFLSLCTYYLGWMSCLISFERCQSRCEERGTASLCTDVPRMPSSNKKRSFRVNIAENME